MPRASFVIGTPSGSGGFTIGSPPNRQYYWGDNTRTENLGALPSGLVADGGAALITEFAVLQQGNVFLSVRRGAQGGQTPGPELTEAWENYARAIMLSAGDWSMVLPGPNVAGSSVRDSSEPYQYLVRDTDYTRDQMAAWELLSDADKASTTLTLFDGIEGVTVAGKGAGAAEFAATAATTSAAARPFTGKGAGGGEFTAAAPASTAPARVRFAGRGSGGRVGPDPIFVAVRHRGPQSVAPARRRVAGKGAGVAAFAASHVTSVQTVRFAGKGAGALSADATPNATRPSGVTFAGKGAGALSVVASPTSTAPPRRRVRGKGRGVGTLGADRPRLSYGLPRLTLDTTASDSRGGNNVQVTASFEFTGANEFLVRPADLAGDPENDVFTISLTLRDIRGTRSSSLTIAVSNITGSSFDSDIAGTRFDASFAAQGSITVSTAGSADWTVDGFDPNPSNWDARPPGRITDALQNASNKAVSITFDTGSERFAGLGEGVASFSATSPLSTRPSAVRFAGKGTGGREGPNPIFVALGGRGPRLGVNVSGRGSGAANVVARRGAIRITAPGDVAFAGRGSTAGAFAASRPSVRAGFQGRGSAAGSFTARRGSIRLEPPGDVSFAGRGSGAARFRAARPFSGAPVRVSGKGTAATTFQVRRGRITIARPLPVRVAGKGVATAALDSFPPRAREPAPEQAWVGWIADISGIGAAKTPFRVWSGEGDLTIDGETYKGTTFGGGALARIQPSEDTVDAPSARASVTIAVPSAAVREMLDIDVGPVAVNVRHVRSRDNGKTWAVVSAGIAGRLSRPQFTFDSSLYTVEIETWSGDSDRGSPRLWSHETQQAEHPGDLGFEFVRELAEGIETRWPP